MLQSGQNSQDTAPLLSPQPEFPPEADQSNARSFAVQIIQSNDQQRLEAARSGQLGPEVQQEVVALLPAGALEGGQSTNTPPGGENQSEGPASEGPDESLDPAAGGGACAAPEELEAANPASVNMIEGTEVDPNVEVQVCEAPPEPEPDFTSDGGGAPGMCSVPDLGGQPDAPVALPGAGAVTPTEQFALHAAWTQSPLGMGSGDYSTYGEAMSQGRIDAALAAATEGAAVGGTQALISGGISAAVEGAAKGMKLSGKAIPVIGSVLSIAGGAYGLAVFDWGGFADRAAKVTDGEAWDEDPWGQLADVFNLIGSLLDILGNVCGIVGGICGLVGLIPGGQPALPVGAALMLAGAIMGLAKTGCFGVATMCRFLSVLTIDGDARQVSQALSNLRGEAAATASGTVGAGMGALKGGKTPAASTKEKFGKIKGADTDAKKLDLYSAEAGGDIPATEAKMAMMAGLEGNSDGGSGPSAGRVANWCLAKNHQAENSGTTDTLRGMATAYSMVVVPPLGALAAPTIAKATQPATFKDLPEAPHAQGAIGQKKLQLAAITGQKNHLDQAITPALIAQGATLTEQKEEAGGVIQSGENMSQQVALARADNDKKKAKQNEADSKLNEMSSAEADAGKGAGQQQAMLGSVRVFVSIVGAIPDFLLPDSVANGVEKARSALGMDDAGSKQAEGDQKKSQATGLIEASKQHSANADSDADAVNTEAQMWMSQGNEGQAQASAAESTNTQTLSNAEGASSDAAKQIADLEAEIATMEASEQSWASVHEAVASENDAFVDTIYGNAAADSETGPTAITPDQKRNIEAAQDDLSSCITFCNKCLKEGNNDSGASLTGVAQKGIEDCQAVEAELGSVAPENYTDIVARAFNTTGRIRSRLEATNS